MTGILGTPDWATVTLGEVTTLQRGFDITKAEQQPGDIPVVSSSGVASYHDQYKVIGPGVVIGRKGSLGTAFYISGNFWPHDTTLWVKDFHGNDPKFCYYLLKTLRLERFDTGASNPTLNRNHVHGLPVRIPSAITQRRIASILSAYDDLIENNTRRIAILEEMARRIYEEWFVRFRFPGHEKVTMVESELGLIPEGWVAAKLGSLIEFKKGKKPALVSNQWSDGLMPHLLIDSLRGADRSEFVISEKMIATTPNDTIMVMDGSGSCDVFIGYEGVIGSTLGRYRVSELSKLSPYWLYLFFVSHLDEIKAKNIGAAIPHANKDFINGMTVPLPMHEISNRFDQTISPIFELVRVMKRKNKNLRATRDLLLPKLISGELDVSTLPGPEEAIAA